MALNMDALLLRIVFLLAAGYTQQPTSASVTVIVMLTSSSTPALCTAHKRKLARMARIQSLLARMAVRVLLRGLPLEAPRVSVPGVLHCCDGVLSWVAHCCYGVLPWVAHLAVVIFGFGAPWVVSQMSLVGQCCSRRSRMSLGAPAVVGDSVTRMCTVGVRSR